MSGSYGDSLYPAGERHAWLALKMKVNQVDGEPVKNGIVG